MNLAEAVAEVKKAAKRSGYEGELSQEALEECAKVFLENCDADGQPRPRVYMRSGEKRRPTNLTEFQWLLVRTPSFKRWFGKSVIVDENGDPKVMYHGSWQHFNEFKTSFIKLSKTAMTLWSGPGFYFTDQEKVAKIYAGGGSDRIYDVFLRLENPLVVDETGNAEDGKGIPKSAAVKIFMDGDNTQWLDTTLAGELARMDSEKGKDGKGKPYYRSLTRQQRVSEYVSRLKTDVVALKTAAQAYGAKSQNKLIAAICRYTGYDGVIHTLTPDVKEWVVYDPKSIKSANANNGEFSTAKAKTEDAADPKLGNVRHKIEVKGSSNMVFKSLIESLTKICSNPAEDHAVAMDIVDRHGRHHQPKAIPEGGQYEEEGQYLTGNAKLEHAMREAGRGKHGTLLREHVAPLYAKLGVDSATRAKIQKMHEDIRGLSKGALMRGMVRYRKEMQRHADNYNAVKDMDKEQFRAWLNEHPEYRIGMVDKLMNESQYNGHRSVKGGYHDDGTGRQKHEAWEEAKWSVGARAMACMMVFQEHADALNGAPDQIMANMIEHAAHEQGNQVGGGENAPQVGAVPNEQITTPTANITPEESRSIDRHTEGNAQNTTSPANTYTDREGNTHQIQHNEGGLKAPIHQSEIGAVQAEMRQAFADAGNGVEGAEEYAHALSHFLGRGNDARSPHPGMRQEGLLKHQLADKMQTRLEAKLTAFNNVLDNGSDEERANAQADLDATRKAVRKIAETCGIAESDLPEGDNFRLVREALHTTTPEETAAENERARQDLAPLFSGGGNAPVSHQATESAAPRMANPDHQPLADALHSIANPQPQAESTTQTSSTTNNATVGEPTESMTATFGQYLDNSESGSGIRDTPESIVDMLNGGAADDEISAIREGYNNPGGTLESNPALADHLEAIRRLPREQQLAHVQRLMGVEPTATESTATTTQNQQTPQGENNTVNGNQVRSLAERIRSEFDRQSRAENGEATHTTAEAIEQSINMALENPTSEYARALMGEVGNRNLTGVVNVANALANDPALQAVRAEIQRRREGATQTSSTTNNATVGEPTESMTAVHGGGSNEITDDQIRDFVNQFNTGLGNEGTDPSVGMELVRDMLNGNANAARPEVIVSQAIRFGIPDNNPVVEAARNILARGQTNGGANAATQTSPSSTQTPTPNPQPQQNPPRTTENAEGNAQQDLSTHLDEFVRGEANQARGRAGLGRGYRGATWRVRDCLNAGRLDALHSNTRDIFNHFGDVNNPLVRRIREIRHNIANHLPVATDDAGHIGMYDEANVSPRYSVNRFNPANAQQVTQRDVDNIISRMNGSAAVPPYGTDAGNYQTLSGLDHQGQLSAFLRNPEMWNGRFANADSYLQRLRRSNNPATKAYVRAFDALHPNFAERAAARQRTEETRRAMNEIAAHTTDTSQNTHAPDGSPLASVTEDQWRNAEQRVNTAMPGHEDVVSRAFRALRSGQVNADVSRYESTIANVLGANDPVVRALHDHIYANLGSDERTRRTFLTTRPTVPAEIKQANDQAMSSFQKVQPGEHFDIDSIGHAYGHNCYMNDLYAMLHHLGYKVGNPPGRDGDHTPRNTKAFFAVKKALLDGGAEPFVPNERGEIASKLEELARTRPNGTWLSIWSGGHNKSAVLQDGKWIFLDAYMGTRPRVMSNDEVAGKVWHRDLVVRGARRDPGLIGAVNQGLIDHNPTDDELAQLGGAMIIDPSKFKITNGLVQAMR